MPKTTFDSNIFIARSRTNMRLPSNFYMSVVVMQELAIGAEDATEIKELDTIWRVYEKAGRLLVPTAEDWKIGGKPAKLSMRCNAASNLSRAAKLPASPPKKKYRLTNDVLIARTAKREGVTVVTDNAKDFEMIRRFCAVKTVSSADYFGS